MVTTLGSDAAHSPPASDLDAEWSWGDGESRECYAEAFGGELPARHVPLMLILQGAAATALLAQTDCCSECRVAAFKHRFVVAYHVGDSLKMLKSTGVLGPTAATRVDAMLSAAPVVDVVGMRALRNGLVHLGLSDVPKNAFGSPDPFGSVVTHYAAGRSLAEVQNTADEAVAALHALLTEWLLTARPGGQGFAGLLRSPA